jgi:hypothetical protein
MATTKQTDREAVIQHFVDRDLGFDDPSHDTIDLVMFLAQDVQHNDPSVFENQRDYVEKITKAGVNSSVGRELLGDIRKAVQTARKAPKTAKE